MYYRTRRTFTRLTSTRSRLSALITMSLALPVLLSACGVPIQPLPPAISTSATAAPLTGEMRATNAYGAAPRSARTQAPAIAGAFATATPIPTPVPPPTPTPLIIPAEPVGEIGAMIDRHMNDLVNIQLFQGTVLVARDGQILLSKGYGFADSERGLANTSSTRFRLASLTKQFTATAIMILQAQGKLNVHESICAYLADCPEAWQSITVHHLLTHTSGIQNYTGFIDYEATQMLPATPAELLARFRDLPLMFAPGTSYFYENSDYVLLGMIIEHVSGDTYAQFLRDAIFAPLGMHDSGVDQADNAAIYRATGYRRFRELAPALDTSTLYSAGALYSTVEDLYRWDQALYGTQVLPQPERDAMWTPFMHGYGYGWYVTDAWGQRKISHPGLMDGFATSIARYPEDRVTIIVLSNMSTADADGINNFLASLLLGG